MYAMFRAANASTRLLEGQETVFYLLTKDITLVYNPSSKKTPQAIDISTILCNPNICDPLVVRRSTIATLEMNTTCLSQATIEIT